MAQVDPGSFTDRLSQIVQDSSSPNPPRNPAALNFRPAGGGEGLLEDTGELEQIPNRYKLRELTGSRALMCNEAPSITVNFDRRYGFSEADARKLGERVILLDGAGQFSPLVDDAAHLYNLDHHEGCSRAFTLATCEQALILVLKGLQLDKGDWTVYANEPDLDTIFAIWVLLNHRRVRQLDTRQRDAIIPLLRLEGAIDANGFEIAEFCGLPQDRLHDEKERLDRLHKIELEVKRTGVWSEVDLAEYSQSMLLEIDRYVFQASDFSDYDSVEEIYGHVDIGADHVAVVCRDGSGIYDVERRLKKVWGDRLGIVALERDTCQYTLRRTAALAGIELEDAYSKLNLLDPVVDGRPPEKRWGGSEEIGGSPRPSGTGLTPLEIGNILKLTFKSATPWQHLQRFATTALWAIGLGMVAALTLLVWRLVGEEQAPAAVAASRSAVELALVATVVSIAAWILTHRLSSGWTWLFGWRRPAGRDWLYLVPLVLAGGALGGAWAPADIPRGELPPLALVATLVAALATELSFRGLLHGLMILDYRVQSVRGRWFLSRPTMATALLFAAMSGVFAWRGWISSCPLELSSQQELGAVVGGALLAGLALGAIRERSLSVWPCFAVMAAGGFLRLALSVGLGV